ncbi:hypothetical protein HBN50_11925 [Halobacteriovorax sp. GB3]|uniref:hypothetical protein n=1 Tax=Halobacteriovorax sp. GB3 TaxID=2719615 RepID=UPI00235F7D41|nr:hypothetical protein [Halobacteriovorax sp. GB3]MDD0853809.1 hypothetical protein [Halobacteriovorax sp. GB3]
MNNKSFKANNWLNIDSDSKKSTSEELPPLPPMVEAKVEDTPLSCESESMFSLGQFLIPEWKGESLFSKEAMRVKNLMEKLFDDALEQVEDFSSRNRSTKIAIFNEFLSYAHEMDLNDLAIDNFNDFWSEYANPFSSDKVKIDSFKKVFAFRAITIYLFKIRFFTLIGNNQCHSITSSDYLTPDYCLRKIFKKGSSSEIDSEALQTNQYSWYRPASRLKETIHETVIQIEKISLAEILKLCRPETFNLGHYNPRDNFSHSLSTRSFGLFLNQLMIEFPAWVENRKIGALNSNSQQVKALNTFFSGDYLQSLSGAHWLAQEHNSQFKWRELLCPDFIGDNYQEGSFLKICHELHFLSFLVDLADKQGHNPVSMICNVYKQKISSSRNNEIGQIGLFDSTSNGDIAYDRLLINLVHLPKKNPHHFLLTKVNQLGKKLASNGYLYLFSNQKLFVPSQSEKLEQLLLEYKVEANFNLEDLKGRGEIPNFLYVLTKRRPHQRAFYNSSVKSQKESLLSFRMAGDLSLFGKFQSFVEEFFQFFESKNPQTTPVYQSEPLEDLTLEFHQDAILEGKLLSSTTSAQGQVTHPNYFKNLMKSCVPFDQFFNIENLQSETSLKNKNITSELLGITFRQEERFPFLLIVDYTNEAQIKIELTTSDLYKAKLEQYGQAYFQYFGLMPKRADININLFREFFNTPIGNQVVQLSLNGGLTKIKSKLRALLIPKFFMDNSFLPKHLAPTLNFLQIDQQELLNSHPRDIESSFSDTKQYLHSIGQKYPWHSLSLLSNFKYHLEACLQSLQEHDVNFYNPLIKEPLCRLETVPVYPNNKEVYLSIEAKDPSDIHAPLYDVSLSKEGDNDCLEIYTSMDNCILKIFSEPVMLGFIHFVLSGAKGTKVSSIIQGLRVPSIEELSSIVDNYDLMTKTISTVHTTTDQLIGQILSQQISTH